MFLLEKIMNYKNSDDIYILEEEPKKENDKLDLQSALEKYFYPCTDEVRKGYYKDDFFDKKIERTKKERSKINPLSVLGKVAFSFLTGTVTSVYFVNKQIFVPSIPSGAVLLGGAITLGAFGVLEITSLSINGIKNAKQKRIKIEQIKQFQKEFNNEKHLINIMLQDVDYLIKYQNARNISKNQMLENMKACAEMNGNLFKLVGIVYGDNLSGEAKSLVDKYTDVSTCYKNPKNIVSDLKKLREQLKNVQICGIDASNLFDKKEKYVLQCARQTFADNLSTIATFVQVTNSIYSTTKENYDKEQQKQQIETQIKQAKETAVFEDFLKEYGVD